MIISATICRNEPDAWLPLMLEQTAKFVDKMIVIVDSNFLIDDEASQNWSAMRPYIQSRKLELVQNRYETDGGQRNAYLNCLKEYYMGSWCVVVDTDELLDDKTDFRGMVETLEREKVAADCFNVAMHHYAWNLGWEDATLPIHFTPTRFFKVTPSIHYEEVEHPILKGFLQLGQLGPGIFHHYGITNGVHMEIQKYCRQCERSNIHSAIQLAQWHAWHIMGELPVKKVSWEQHPAIVRERFKA